jgi:hypothetical protein
MLLTLLESPAYSMPLTAVKELMAKKAGDIGAEDVGDVALAVGGGGAMKVYYACVAKRLLKVDRASREQMVKFNVA